MKIPFNLFVTATISCQQLIVAVSADENENQRRDLKFGTHFKFIVYTQYYFFIISCQQLITDGENENQPRELKLPNSGLSTSEAVLSYQYLHLASVRACVCPCVTLSS